MVCLQFGRSRLHVMPSRTGLESRLVAGQESRRSSHAAANPWLPATSRSNTYVDDPLLATMGRTEHREMCLVGTLLVWSMFALRLAWRTGATWTSVCSRQVPGCQYHQFLETFVGSCVHASSLLVWRPVVAVLWGELSSLSPDAPVNSFWTQQVMVSLCWLGAFLNRCAGTLQRSFILSSLESHISALTFCPDGMRSNLTFNDAVA